MLPVHQELLLLAIADDGSVEFTAGTSTFQLALCGACLIDLASLGHIDVDLDEVRVRDRTPPENSTLKQVMELLTEHSTPQRLRFWLGQLREVFPDLSRSALSELCDQGILEAQESRFLWVLASRKYPVVDGREKKEAKLRIMETLLGEEIPSPEDSILIGLARSSGVLQGFLTAREIAGLEERMDKVGNLDLTAGLIEKAIQEEQEELARAMLLNPYPI